MQFHFHCRYTLQGSSLWAEKGYPFPKDALSKANDAAIQAEDKFKPANRPRWSKSLDRQKGADKHKKLIPKPQRRTESKG